MSPRESKGWVRALWPRNTHTRDSTHNARVCAHTCTRSHTGTPTWQCAGGWGRGRRRATSSALGPDSLPGPASPPAPPLGASCAFGGRVPVWSLLARPWPPDRPLPSSAASTAATSTSPSSTTPPSAWRSTPCSSSTSPPGSCCGPSSRCSSSSPSRPSSSSPSGRVGGLAARSPGRVPPPAAPAARPAAQRWVGSPRPPAGPCSLGAGLLGGLPHRGAVPTSPGRAAGTRGPRGRGGRRGWAQVWVAGTLGYFLCQDPGPGAPLNLGVPCTGRTSRA